jgi:hypothetical protein
MEREPMSMAILWLRFRGWASRLAARIAGRKRIEVTIESHRVLIVRRLRSSRLWCPHCGREMDMVRAEDAVALTQSERGRNHLQLPENGAACGWHGAQDADGAALICLESLIQSH